MSLNCNEIFQQLSAALGKSGIFHYKQLLLQFLSCSSTFEADIVRDDMIEFLRARDAHAEEKRRKKQEVAAAAAAATTNTNSDMSFASPSVARHMYGDSRMSAVALHNQLIQALLAPDADEAAEARQRRRQREEATGETIDDDEQQQCSANSATNGLPLQAFVFQEAKRLGIDDIKDPAAISNVLFDAVVDVIEHAVRERRREND